MRAKPDCAWPPRRLQPHPIDELTVTRLQRLPFSGDEIWEIDFVPLTMVQELGPDERWPILVALLIVDRWTGRPRHVEQVPAPDRHASAGLRLARALLKIGARPAQMRVRDYRLRAGIAEVARAIGAKLITVRHLPAMDAAYDVLRAVRESWPGRSAGT